MTIQIYAPVYVIPNILAVYLANFQETLAVIRKNNIVPKYPLFQIFAISNIRYIEYFNLHPHSSIDPISSNISEISVISNTSDVLEHSELSEKTENFLLDPCDPKMTFWQMTGGQGRQLGRWGGVLWVTLPSRLYPIILIPNKLIPVQHNKL